MSLRRLAANTLQDSLLLLTPRRSLARFGRFLYNTARLDLANEIHKNGEKLVQRTIVAGAPSTRPLTIFDVGANQGDWTNPLLDYCAEFQCNNLALYCFEPVASTMAILKRNTVRPNSPLPSITSSAPSPPVRTCPNCRPRRRLRHQCPHSRPLRRSLPPGVSRLTDSR